MPDTDVTKFFFNQGVLGVIIVILAGVFVFYYRSSEKQKREDATKIFDLQEARRVDYKEITEKVTTVVQNNSQNMLILSEKIEVGKANDRRRR